MARRRKHRRRRRSASNHDSGHTAIHLWETHLPVLAARRTDSGGLETPRPVIYGTAFPIAAGIFATALHVIQAARVDGIPGLSVVQPGRSAG